MYALNIPESSRNLFLCNVRKSLETLKSKTSQTPVCVHALHSTLGSEIEFLKLQKSIQRTAHIRHASRG